MSAVKFIDGPVPTNKNKRWGAVRDELRANPGIWAEVFRLPKAEYTKVANTRLAVSSRFDDIEAVTRIEGAEAVVYARAVA